MNNKSSRGCCGQGRGRSRRMRRCRSGRCDRSEYSNRGTQKQQGGVSAMRGKRQPASNGEL